MFFSKSKFVASCCRCDKYLWLDKYKPEVKIEPTDFTQSLFENGHKVGDLAKQYYKIDVDVTTTDENGRLDLSKMLEKTAEHIKLGTKVIAEASFSLNGLFCSVDILIQNNDGNYNIYEVKSSKKDEPTKANPLGIKERYILDVSYQRYVLEQCGIKIDKTYVVMLANDYVCGKSFELDKYFAEYDITDETAQRQSYVKNKLFEIDGILKCENEPSTIIAEYCCNCEYFDYCTGNLPKPTVFEASNLGFGTKCKFYNEGISYFDIPAKKPKLNNFVRRQIEYYNKPDETYIDKNAVKEFLSDLEYPLYSLDFETYQAVVPVYEGVRTYEQIPFQYSLHIIKRPDADVSDGSKDIEELGFLDLSGNDTRRAIAESLVKDIPRGACVIAYNKTVESGIIRHLADLFPDLSDHLLSYTYRDPSTIFSKGYYYTKAMGNKYSIKSVLPALYPEDESMNYHNLEGEIQNGAEAMSVFGKLDEMSEQQKEKIYNDLKHYCALDTFAIVKILKKFYEVTK